MIPKVIDSQVDSRSLNSRNGKFSFLKTWQNASIGLFRTTVGHVFLEYCCLPYHFFYKKDFFRNTLWEVLDEPAPIETILQFIRRYGMLPTSLLKRIYFYEAKKKRRAYRSIERVMTKKIAQIFRKQRHQQARTAQAPRGLLPLWWPEALRG